MTISRKKGLVENRYRRAQVDAGGRLRMVGVSYLNAQPTLWGLLQGLGEDRMHLELAPPAELSRRLFEDEADAALAPVASLATHGGLEVVPGVAIGCDGPVRSVRILAGRPLGELDTLLIDASSRTSVVLARLVIRHLLGGKEPRYSAMPAPEIAARVGGATGGLLIGDAALEVEGRFTHEIDLGAAWKDMTGLPFVFAVWAARPGVLTPRDALVLQGSLAAGLADRRGIAQAWSRGHGGHADAHVAYLERAIRYPLDDAALAGLREFLRRAAEAGLLPEADLRFVGEAPALSTNHGATNHGATAAARAPTPHRRSIDDLLDHAAGGGRLSFEDAMRLGQEAATHDLGLAADLRRRALHPEGVVTYIVDRNVNYTNVCTTACRFCAFYRPVGHAEGYVLTREELGAKIQETLDAGGIQILLQGGLNPALHLEWYEDLFRWMKASYPIALHALSPEEIWHLVRLEDLTVEQVLSRLKAAGMDSLPGGGAEVLTDRVRSKIAKAKCTSAEWLEVMRVAHRIGMRTTATMMFGTADTLADRVLHMLKIRELQDETGGFTAFICWDYRHEQGTRAVAGETGSVLYLRTQALGRLVIDNVHNVQTSWVTQGPGVGQVALRYGANDMGSTMFEENVVSAAGTTFGMDAAQIERHARASGFPVARRNMRYEWLTAPA
jgi:cyclic dehypoxanthinyl futalosine synthase